MTEIKIWGEVFFFHESLHYNWMQSANWRNKNLTRTYFLTKLKHNLYIRLWIDVVLKTCKATLTLLLDLGQQIIHSQIENKLKEITNYTDVYFVLAWWRLLSSIFQFNFVTEAKIATTSPFYTHINAKFANRQSNTI